MGSSIAMRKFGKPLMLACLALSAPLTIGAVDPMGNLDARLLAAHNRERATAGVPALQWDDALARDAAMWAEHLTRAGYLIHYEEHSEDWDAQGENLWAGTKGYYNPEAMVGLWIAEKTQYKPGVFPANSRTGRLEDIGHYTQLMWRSTTHVGCAVARGAEDDFLVCRYAEGGNVLGEVPF